MSETGYRVIRQLSDELWELEGGKVMNIASGTIFKMNTLVKKVPYASQVPYFESLGDLCEQEENQIGMFVATCKKVWQRGKTIFCTLESRKETFDYIMKGKRLIGEHFWEDFNHNFITGETYLIIARKLQMYPMKIKIERCKKLKNIL